MTTGENTDSLDNVTVTSDEAFERVTSDIKDEYTDSDGSLKQNTAGLINEIPNISILDISDFLIENKKTLYDRQNWNIVVGKAGRSIEAQPQDIARLMYNDDRYDSNEYVYSIPFDSIVKSNNITTYSISNGEIIISIPGVYRVTYGWTANTGGATDFRIGLYKNGYYVTSDRIAKSSALGYARLPGGRTISVVCEEGDRLALAVTTDYAGTSIYGYNETYLEIQYAHQSL